MGVCVGTAGWALPKSKAREFPGEGSHLFRYGMRFNSVEVNSSFYRPHLARTYTRWASSVPEHFRFAVKMPRAITHFRRLKGVREPLQEFLESTAGLGDKLGVILIQTPPSLEWDRVVCSEFFSLLRERYQGPLAFEPRHPSWFDGPASLDMLEWQVSRVASDPAIIPAAAIPGGDRRLVYFRLHGSPRVFYSDYPQAQLIGLAQRVTELQECGVQVWCMFDNTAEGAAIGNALTVHQLVSPDSPSAFNEDAAVA